MVPAHEVHDLIARLSGVGCDENGDLDLHQDMRALLQAMSAENLLEEVGDAVHDDGVAGHELLEAGPRGHGLPPQGSEDVLGGDALLEGEGHGGPTSVRTLRTKHQRNAASERLRRH